MIEYFMMIFHPELEWNDKNSELRSRYDDIIDILRYRKENKLFPYHARQSN